MALGLGGVAAATVPVLGACGVGGRTNAPNGAGAVSGGFDWKKASGQTINILQTPHPYQLSYQPLLAEFTELTGIKVNVDLVPEADYFTKLNTELAGGSGKHDAFMLGAHLGPYCWPAAIRMIESGVLPMDKICTHQLPLSEFQKGLDLVASGAESVKVSLIPA